MRVAIGICLAIPMLAMGFIFWFLFSVSIWLGIVAAGTFLLAGIGSVLTAD